MADNPYAFPFPGETCEGSTCSQGAPGMELRDYFAAHALIGLLTQTTVPEAARSVMDVAAERGVAFHTVLAKNAYVYADEMLAAREKDGA
jgi:hypothetical protein